MVLKSSDPVEFRIQRKYEGRNGISYIYTFEAPDLGSFELWSKKDLDVKKGSMYNLLIDMGSFNGDMFYRLSGVEAVGR